MKLLISSVETDLAQRQENALAARSTVAWLTKLRENLAEIERDTEEAFEKRRELVKLLVERLTVGRAENGRARVDITYRFGPPADQPETVGASSVDRVNNSPEL